MKKSSFIILIALTAIATLAACKNSNPPAITMQTAKEGEVSIYLLGKDTATVHWGDGKTETQVLDTLTNATFERTGSGERVIAISGDSITGFYCEVNSLTELDISKCTQLEWIACDYNDLTTLDVSKNPQLERLDCSGNHLSTLNVSKNPKLKVLNCSGNRLSTLNVSKNPKLEMLACNGNRLNTHYVSKYPKLEVLFCRNNRLTTLDVSKNPQLEELDCSNNHLKTLIVSRNTRLRSLVCYDNQLNADALNDIFRNLPTTGNESKIEFGGNPGTDNCNWSLAPKSWEVSNLLYDASFID